LKFQEFYSLFIYF